MLKIPRRTVLITATTALVCALALSGTALAAGSLAPQLRSPGAGKTVTAGHVRLTVYIPDPGNVIKGHIFLIVSDKRIVKRGLLYTPKQCGFRCNIATMKRVGTHLYSYVDPYHFAGNWQDTAGKYFWQAYYYPKGGVIGVLPSRIASFRVVG